MDNIKYRVLRLDNNGVPYPTCEFSYYGSALEHFMSVRDLFGTGYCCIEKIETVLEFDRKNENA